MSSAFLCPFLSDFLEEKPGWYNPKEIHIRKAKFFKMIFVKQNVIYRAGELKYIIWN